MTKTWQPYFGLVVCLLAVSTNLGLVNRYVAIQNAQSEGILGLRDILMVPVILVGLCEIDGKPVLHSALSKIVLAFLFLTPVAACTGYFFGARPYVLLGEFTTMATWSLALLMGQYLQDMRRLKAMCNIYIWLGILTSIGVFIEGASGGAIAIVTPNTEALSSTVRSTPTGWPMMMMASSCLSVSILQRSNNTRLATLLQLGLFGVIVVASLLTQSRTLLVGIFASSAIYFAFCVGLVFSRIPWPHVIAVGGLGVMSLPLVCFFGQNWLRADFQELFCDRYVVLLSSEAAQGHLASEGRMLELEVIYSQCFWESPVFGFGLASPYMPIDENYSSDYTLVHSAFGYFLLRYGPAGLLLWCLFIVAILRSVSHFVRSTGPLRQLGQAFSVAMLNMVICSFFGNEFAVPYGVQQTMIALGALIACHQLDRCGKIRIESRSTRSILRVPSRQLSVDACPR
jgi:hypothetical protein